MNSERPYESVQRILQGHRRGHCDLERAVDLLENLWRDASEGGRKGIDNALRTTLSSEPLEAPRRVGNYSADVLRVAVRAIATFGPTANLPNLVFGRLPWERPDLASVWAHGICHELSYSMLHHAERFTQATLDGAKAHCAPQSFWGGARIRGVEIPQVLIEAAADLERTIEQIEFSRFAETLGEQRQGPRAQASELEGLLTAAGMPTQIKTAMEQAESYLRGTGPFDPKHAADLIRTCMDETHRRVVSELETITGQKYTGRDLDGDRRTYMRRVNFINEDEEKFFSCVYTLISREGSHRLLAPRETVLVMERTVRGYLLLLLRRLLARRSSPPRIP